jgi:hypothetical protein
MKIEGEPLSHITLSVVKDSLFENMFCFHSILQPLTIFNLTIRHFKPLLSADEMGVCNKEGGPKYDTF